MTDVNKLLVNLMSIVLANLMPDVHMLTCIIWMPSFAASANGAGFLSNFSPINYISDQHQCANLMLWAFASMCNQFQNKSLTHIFTMDLDIWYVNWAVPCYFNGASPTRSPRWSQRSKHQLACEGGVAPSDPVIAQYQWFQPIRKGIASLLHIIVLYRCGGFHMEKCCTILPNDFAIPMIWTNEKRHYIINLHHCTIPSWWPHPVIMRCCLLMEFANGGQINNDREAQMSDNKGWSGEG